MADTLYVVIPAYNEEANVCGVVAGWHDAIERCGGPDSRLLVVDDGSRDGTRAVLDALARDYPLLEVVTKPNGGHGDTVLYGYLLALEAGADWVFQTDSDGQTDPAEFAGFWEGREAWDAVIGVRVVRGDGRVRAFVERVLCLVLRHYFGVSLPDANAPFRLMRAEALARHVPELPEHYNLPNAVLTALFVREGERVDFREVSFGARRAGANTINVRRIVGIGWRALGDFRRIAQRDGRRQ